MIKLTRLNGSQIIVNSDLIEFIELTPDTVISLTTGEKILVREGAEDIISRIVDFKRMVYNQDIAVHVSRSPHTDRTDGEPHLRIVDKD